MNWVAVALLGGVVGLDSSSFPQVMLSRPFVAGTLTGLLFGRPLEGAMVGLLLEASSLSILPIGAARYPESGTAAVAATAAYLAATPPGLDPIVLLLALGFGLAWEPAAGASVVLLRRRNGRRLTGKGAVAPERLERLHLAAMTLDVLRGALVAVSGGLVGAFGLRLLRSVWGLPEAATLPLLGVFLVAMLGTAVPLFGFGRRAWLALAGGLAGGLLLAAVAS